MIRRVILSSILRSDWESTVTRRRRLFASGSFNMISRLLRRRRSAWRPEHSRRARRLHVLGIPAAAAEEYRSTVRHRRGALAIGRGQKNVALKAPVQLLYIVDIERLMHTSGFQEPGLQDATVSAHNRKGTLDSHGIGTSGRRRWPCKRVRVLLTRDRNQD